MFKQKNILILIFLMLLVKFADSQSWHTYFGDTVIGNEINSIYCNDSSFIIVGVYGPIGDQNYEAVFRWQNYKWYNYGIDVLSSYPTCVNFYRNKLYVGSDGGWAPFDNSHGLKVWDGLNWGNTDQPVNSGNVKDIEVINDSLYIVGEETSGTKVCVFDGTNWQNIGPVYALHGTCITNYNDMLIVGSNNGMWQRNGFNTWSHFNGTPDGWVNAMLVDSINNFLYVGGSFYFVDDTIQSRCIAKYDGFRWYSMELGVWGDVWKNSIAQYRSDIYIGGAMDVLALDTTRINFIACWDGEHWNAVGGGTDAGVFGMAVFQDTLIITGEFSHVNALNEPIPTNRIAKWYMPPANDCRYLQPVLHAWQDEWVSEDEFYLIDGEAVVNFYNNNAYVDSWEWDFGTSTGSVTASQTVEYTYNYPGTYNVQVTVTDGQCVKTAEKEIKIFLNTSISEESKQNSLNVFPNPAGEKLNIECFVPDDATEATLQIISPTGQTLKLISLSKGENKMNISTTEWDCDFVIVNLVIDNKVCNPRKVIIEKK
mgnify:CR=1 FL=1